MKTIKVVLKNYKTKEGREFSKMTIKGKYIPLASANEETFYLVKFVKVEGKDVPVPTKEGIYQVACDDNGLWIDSRPEYASKNILRVKAVRVVFDKNIPSKDIENDF